jgi:membrane-associated phospholipid phosphatase
MVADLSAWERRGLIALQERTRGSALVPAAKVLSAAGEHAAGWLAIVATGAVVDPRRRREWVTAGISVLGAHAGAVVVKRVVRRQRPAGAGLEAWDRTASSLSFPSAHASSSVAAAAVLMPLVGVAPVPAAAAVCAARLVLGVHYPTDVLAGAAWGALASRLVRRAGRPAWAA